MLVGFTAFLRRQAIALLALFVALGGTSFAAANLISGSQIKPHTIAKNRLTNSAVRQLHGTQGARGPAGPQGAQGAPGANGTAVAYALVAADGTVNPALAKNVATSNVLTPNVGGYCISGLSFTPKNVVATLESPPAYEDLNIAVGLGPGNSVCGPATQIRIFIKRGSTAQLVNNGFFLNVN